MTDSENRPRVRRTALVGAGFIASIHARALGRRRGVRLVAVCDPRLERARALARQHGVERVHGSIEELLDAGGVDAAHVLVPPDLHEQVTTPLLRAGVHVLVEKPLVTRAVRATELARLAHDRGVALGVNHSMVFQPMVRRLLDDLAAGRLGRLEHVALVHNVPLRQLQSGDVAHFMFRAEANILHEQAVHPLSVVERLLGRCLEMTARVEAPRRLPTGEPFRDRWTLAMRCERGTAQVMLAFGRDLQETTLHAIGTDGAVRADLTRSASVRIRKTRWLEFWDTASNGLLGGLRLIGDGLGAAADYGLGLFGLRRDPDGFLQSMGASIAAFHDALDRGQPPPCDAEAARQVLEMCEMAAADAGVSWQRFAPFHPAEPGPPRPGEVLLTGATGFLGRYLVEALRAAGRPVTVLVRRPAILPEVLRDETIRVFVGDASDPAAVRAAAAGARQVVHMATCASDTDMEAAMVAGVDAVAGACLQQGVERMVFLSSTAALYLGADGRIGGDAGTDPKPSHRAAYARGKIAAERALRRWQRERALAAVVLRPAIVVGPGGVANHSGVGLWVRDNCCVGWGMGRVPLPLVLARDCAAAIVASLTAPGIEGRSYNLAGPVRPTAQDYVAELRRRTGRPFTFHPQPVWSIQLLELAKWCIKVAARRPRELPRIRDFRSRGFFTELDCSDAERDLGWRPETDGERVLQEAFGSAAAAR